MSSYRSLTPKLNFQIKQILNAQCDKDIEIARYTFWMDYGEKINIHQGRLFFEGN